MLSRDNDSSLIIWIALGERAYGFENLRGLFRVENIVTSPNLL